MPGCYPEAGGWQAAAQVRILPSPPLHLPPAQRAGRSFMAREWARRSEIRVLVQAKGIDPRELLDLVLLGIRA